MLWMKVLGKGMKGLTGGGIGFGVAAGLAYLITTYLPETGLTEVEIITVLGPILTGLFHAGQNAMKHKNDPEPSTSNIRPMTSSKVDAGTTDPFGEGKVPMPTRIKNPPSLSNLGRMPPSRKG